MEVRLLTQPDDSFLHIKKGNTQFVMLLFFISEDCGAIYPQFLIPNSSFHIPSKLTYTPFRPARR